LFAWHRNALCQRPRILGEAHAKKPQTLSRNNHTRYESDLAAIMAKTAKVKKREVSIHSRAARRGEDSARPEVIAKPEETDYKPWLHNAQNAGIHKRKKVKSLTRQQKMRQQKGLEHAERNLDKLEKKVTDSKGRAKKVQARRQDWEELNDRIAGKENREEKVEKSAKDGVKAMEGVEMPDLEQPLPIRTAELDAPT
jgi:predicted RNase H-like nuclease (RuvC/YqgF family)